MKILWLKSELLHPVDKGGKIRTYQMLKHLNRKHHVTFLALTRLNDPAEAKRQSREYCQRLIAVPFNETGRFSPSFYRDLLLNFRSPLPYAVEKYRSRQMRGEIERQERENRYDVVVSDFLVPALNMPDGVSAAKVLFQHNVESELWRRRYENQSNPITRSYFRAQWQKMTRFEDSTCKKFDAIVAVSRSDRDFIKSRFRADEVYDVPTGVDTEYFCPLDCVRKGPELVFTGSMDWMPNEDAMVHFTSSILPAIAASIPEVKLTIVGRSPTRRIRSLDRPPRVTVTGFVDDVRPYLDRAAVYVVPIREGGGTRLKIFEAMSMGKAVVSTTIGAEGLPVRHGEHLLIADEPREFAQAVLRLVTDRDLAERLGQRARALVTEHFSWERAASVFSAVCEHAARKRNRAVA